MNTKAAMTVAQKVEQAIKAIPLPVADDIARMLWKQMNHLEHDSAELDRTKQLVNAVGKMTKIYQTQAEAYALASITPSHENMPFFIPENAVSVKQSTK